MQSLDVISVNIWQILISLANLLILFLGLKHFLFKPVNDILAKRKQEVDAVYASAAKANEQAEQNRKSWEQKLHSAQEEADSIISDAATTASLRGERIIEDAKEKAEGIISQAHSEAELYLKKAEAGVKTEIVDISYMIAQKMLNREISTEDHRDLIASAIENIGDTDDGNE